MIIYGVALLAACTLLGGFIGNLLGNLLDVRADVGGVGIAMILLIVARLWLEKRGLLKDVAFGVGFWAAMYIPIVVAMAAQQDVLSAVKSGPMVLIAVVLTVVACGAILVLFNALDTQQADREWASSQSESQQNDLEMTGRAHD
jgi:malonate transporter MadL subunit